MHFWDNTPHPFPFKTLFEGKGQNHPPPQKKIKLGHNQKQLHYVKGSIMGIHIPDQSPDDNPLVPILMNPKWIPVLIGLILDNLLNRNYWAGTEGEIDDVIDDVDNLVYILSGTTKEVLLLALIQSEWLLEPASAVFQAYDSAMLLASFNPTAPDTSTPLKKAGTANTTTIDTAGTATQSVGNSGGNEVWVAQSFQVTEGYLDAFNLNFSTNSNSPTGLIAWEIRTDSSGSPSGTILDSGTFTPTPNADNTITGLDGILLVSGVTYWFLVRCNTAQSSGNAFRLRVNTGNPYANGVIKTSINSGSTWSLNASGGTDIRMTITTNTEHTKTSLAQTMLTDRGGELDTLQASLRKVGTPTGNLIAKLYSDYQGEPASLLSTSDSLSVASLGTSFGNELFTFSTPYEVAANTLYWLVLESTHTPSDSDYVEWEGLTS